MGKTLSTAKPLQIFKPGRHVDMAGQTIAFSEADLLATCAKYDPKLHEAPLVVGHPQHDLPAYGWVRSLAFADGAIDAMPAQVNPDFADMVAAGAFKKISAAFYTPDAPQNPVPGVFYLRHVGFLGAAAPAVKGLRSPTFAGDEAGVVTFSEWDDVDNASLWRSMREWLIGKFGLAEADAVLPQYKVQSVEQGAQDELRDATTTTTAGSPMPAFAAHQPEESTVTAEEKAALEASNARLASELQTERAKNAQAARDKAHADHVSFAEGLVGQGRLLPAWRDMAVATLDHFAAQPAVVEFGEGEAKAPLADSFKAMLAALPEQVSFGESATKDRAGEAAGTVSFAAPAGYSVDTASAALHAKARAYQAKHSVDFTAAVAAVQQGLG